MTTLIVQSHSEVVPDWVLRCTTSVRTWAQGCGFDYCLMGDDFLALAPADVRAHCQSQPVVVTDVARLVWIKRSLERFKTVVWLDADFLIFAPERFVLLDSPYAVGREVWVQTDARGELRSHKKVHNAFLMFRQGNVFLDFYLESALRLVRANQGSFSPQFAGPKLLTALHNAVQLPVAETAGMLSPEVADAILTEQGKALTLFLERSDEKPSGVNLCSSLRRSEQTMNALVERLIQRGL